MSKFLKFIVHFIVICTIICVVGLAVPPFLGITTEILDDSSKETNLPMGSVTYAIPVKTEEAAVGDSILYQGDSKAYKYMITEIDQKNKTFQVIDASNSKEKALTVQAKEYFPKVVITIGYVGYLLIATESIEGLIILGLAVLFLIILYIIAELWKKDPQDDYDEMDTEPGYVKSKKELKREEYQEMNPLRKAVADLKNEIRSLGSVNVNAIEEYKELFDRHGFLKEQHDDLVESEKVLLGVIDELDAGMRRQFEENFVRIQAEFDKAFRQLFGGGHGKLELVEGEDILEAGVRIIAQPPGKKLQNMILLSGGEKALTAIALLFAIQNLKPSPFCLLDEIEAALDESNVARYANYLHKLTKNTQFIIITHRRGTMAAADRLYGITMQEKGVSALVSVNLIEDDLDE